MQHHWIASSDTALSIYTAGKNTNKIMTCLKFKWPLLTKQASWILNPVGFSLAYNNISRILLLLMNNNYNRAAFFKS